MLPDEPVGAAGVLESFGIDVGADTGVGDIEEGAGEAGTEVGKIEDGAGTGIGTIGEAAPGGDTGDAFGAGSFPADEGAREGTEGTAGAGIVRSSGLSC